MTAEETAQTHVRIHSPHELAKVSAEAEILSVWLEKDGLQGVGRSDGKIKAVPPGRHRNGVCTSFSVEAGRRPNRALASA